MKFGEATWKILLGLFLRRAWRYIWCLTSKCALRQPVISCWSNLEKFPIKLYALNLTTGFQLRVAHVPSSWLVNHATSLSWHLIEEGFNTWHKLTTIWKATWGLSHWETHNNPTRSKMAFDDVKEAFLAKEWNSFYFSWKKLNYLHLKDFLKYECEVYLKQPLAPPQHKIITTYRTSNHRLAIKTGR